MTGPTFAVGALALSMVAGGCAQTAFSPSFPDNRLEPLQPIVAAIRPRPMRPSNSTGKPLAFMLTSAKTSELVTYDLEGSRILWRQVADVTSRVTVGKNFIFHRNAAGQLVGRRVSDGAVAWQYALPEGERLLGTSADGDLVYVVTEVLKRSGGSAAARILALNGETGAMRWERESSGRLGVAAARDGYVFVPLRSQSLAILDGNTGDEKARIRSREEVLLWARSDHSGVLFGGRTGIYRLDNRAVSGAKDGASFVAAPLPASVRPVYWWNGYNAALADYTAYDRNRLLWRAAADTKLGFIDNMVFVHNYRFVFAFHTEKGGAAAAADKPPKTADDHAKAADESAMSAGHLRWAYSYPRHDAVASTHTGRALLMVTDNGQITALDPRSGAEAGQRSLKLSIAGATFDADGYGVNATAKPAVNLRRTLRQVIWDPDRRFGAVKLFAVEQLARIPGPSVAEDLVKIVTRTGIDKAVYKRAGEVLVQRHDKRSIPLYLRTLKPKYDFVQGTTFQAVDIMARALGDLRASEAVQPLLRHLADHETPIEALADIVAALAAIKDRSIIEPFRDFLLTYRCDPAFGGERSRGVLNLIAEALLKMGGDEERQLLSFVANDLHTLEPLRAYVGKALRDGPGGATSRRASAGATSPETAASSSKPKTPQKAIDRVAGQRPR